MFVCLYITPQANTLSKPRQPAIYNIILTSFSVLALRLKVLNKGLKP